MRIGVSGASGHLGRAVVSELLQRPGGHEVVAISRTPETVSGPAQGRFADYNRPESLAEAYAGLDRLLIITTVDPEPGKRGAQIIAAIDAAVKAGVKHIVLMSAVGTRQEEEPARGASYWRGEQHLIATAPAWTILRMNFYAEAFVQLAQAALKQGVLTGLAENRAAFVARDDVAAAAAGILVGDGHAGAICKATGPERLSGAERAAVISEITGRPLAFRVNHGRATARWTNAGRSARGGRQHRCQYPGELRGRYVRHCDRRPRAPWRPAAQASPRRACWGAEISFGLKTYIRSDGLANSPFTGWRSESITYVRGTPFLCERPLFESTRATIVWPEFQRFVAPTTSAFGGTNPKEDKCRKSTGSRRLQLYSGQLGGEIKCKR